MEKRKRDGNLMKREPKDQHLLIRLSKTDLELINRLSVYEDISMAQLIRKAVKLYSDYYRT